MYICIGSLQSLANVTSGFHVMHMQVSASSQLRGNNIECHQACWPYRP